MDFIKKNIVRAKQTECVREKEKEKSNEKSKLNESQTKNTFYKLHVTGVLCCLRCGLFPPTIILYYNIFSSY